MSNTMISRAVTGAGGALLLMGAVLASGQTAHATVASTAASTAVETSSVDCVVSDPDHYNDWSFAKLSNPYGKGEATFYEYDELLVVEDHDSDGMRVAAQLEWCYNGQWRYYGTFTSGPNEGAKDIETHDLDFREGRKVRFKVCAWNQQYGYAVSCTKTAKLAYS